MLPRKKIAGAVIAAAFFLGLSGCGDSAADNRFLASVQKDAPGMSQDGLLQAGHDFCDHCGDSDGGYGAISYVGDKGVALNIGLTADLYLYN